MKSKIWELINESNSIVLLTHENPDGDAIGSVMAFFHYLSSINKTVDIVLEKVPKVFNYLDDINRFVDNNNNKEYDLGIILDCASKERISLGNDTFNKCNKTIVIDHHYSNTRYGDFNYIEDTAPACCQIIYYLLKDWKIKINKKIAEDLITGLLTDTNGFKNNNINKNSFCMAADIIDMGIDISLIYNKILCKKTMAKYKLTEIAMRNLEFFCENKIAFSYILLQDMVNAGAEYGEHEGLVEIGRDIEGVYVSVFIREDDDGSFNVSLRSNGIIDVSLIAKKFDGGGHKMAAGIKLTKNFQESKNMLIDEIMRVINK